MSSNIEYHKFRHGETCTTTGCRSRSYYIADGKRVCKSHGHVQEGFTQIAQDEDDFGTQGKRTRRKKDAVEKVKQVFEGKQALVLWCEVVQLVLRRQVKWVIEEGYAGEDLEVVVRDLWALRLRNVKGLGDEDGGGYASGSQSGSGWSSTSEGETDGEVEFGVGLGRKLKKIARDKGVPKLVETLAVCYLGCLLLRLPVTLAEFQDWADSDGFPYFGMINDLPKDMLSHLPAQYIAALEPRAALRPGQLQLKVQSLITMYKRDFEIPFPPVNSSLIAFKNIKTLCLPLEVYPCTFRLAKALDIDFKYPEVVTVRTRSIEYPEIQIMTLIVISTKLLQPLDGVTRRAETIEDQAVTKVDWPTWQEAVSNGNEQPKLDKFAELNEDDVFTMSEEKLDSYLNWYQRSMLTNKEDKLSKQLLDLFPLDPLPRRNGKQTAQGPEMANDALMYVQGTVQTVEPMSTDEAEYAATLTRPGMRYRLWKKMDDLSGVERVFVGKAAEQAGVDVEVLVRAVNSVEIKLQKVMKKMKGLK